MIYVKYTEINDDFTIWEMSIDLSKQKCIYSSNPDKINTMNARVEYDDSMAKSDVKFFKHVTVITQDEAFIEII